MSKFDQEDIYWIDLMIEYATDAIEYYEEIKRSSYRAIIMKSLDDSLAASMARIGEQLDPNKLSKKVQERYPEIPWRSMKDFRNLHDHWYQDLRMPQVYEIADSFLEDLLQSLYEIREDLIRERDDNR